MDIPTDMLIEMKDRQMDRMRQPDCCIDRRREGKKERQTDGYYIRRDTDGQTDIEKQMKRMTDRWTE